MSEETGTGIITDEERRDALRRKIAASEARNARRSLGDQAKDAADTALEYVREHPLRSVAAVAVGALLIGALTRPGRRLGRRGGKMASLAAEAALAYGLHAFEAASEAAGSGQDRLAGFGDKVGLRVRGLRRQAVKEAGDAGDKLRTTARSTSRSARRSIRELRSRLTN